jgi:ATP-dependent helicase/DNAse subunit B
MTLQSFLAEQNITNFEALKLKCINIGVEWPSEDIFNKLKTPVVTNQNEGIVVIEPLIIVQESSGKERQEEDFLEEVLPKKQRKSKKIIEE